MVFHHKNKSCSNTEKEILKDVKIEHQVNKEKWNLGSSRDFYMALLYNQTSVVVQASTNPPLESKTQRMETKKCMTI